MADGPSFQSAEEFSQYLIREHLISSVPWDDAGQYVRFSVTFQANGIEEELRVIQEIEDRLRREFGAEKGLWFLMENDSMYIKGAVFYLSLAIGRQPPMIRKIR